MALDAGFCHDINNGIYLCAPMHIERFAALVAAAKCEELADEAECNGNTILAQQIRARGQE